MLKWALVFAVISLIALMFDFTGIAAGTAEIARILFFIAVTTFIVLMVFGLTLFKSVT